MILRFVRFTFIVLTLAGVFLVQSNGFAQGMSNHSPTWDIHFSPRGGATFAIRQALDNAKSCVLVQAYSFTSAQIAEALVKAHRRGVKIRVLLDKNQKTDKYSFRRFPC